MKMRQYAVSVLAHRANFETKKPDVFTAITQRFYEAWHNAIAVTASSRDEAIGMGYGHLEEEHPNGDGWAHHVLAIEIERLENDGND